MQEDLLCRGVDYSRFNGFMKKNDGDVIAGVVVCWGFLA